MQACFFYSAYVITLILDPIIVPIKKRSQFTKGLVHCLSILSRRHYIYLLHSVIV